MMKISVAVLGLFVAASVARCQLAEVGPGPPDLHYCDKVKVDPNLVLSQDARISGRLVDPSGAAFENSLVELRLYISPTKQSAVAKVTTDQKGQLRFDSVKAGKYRLIGSPTRAFQQPSELRCESNECCGRVVDIPDLSRFFAPA